MYTALSLGILTLLALKTQQSSKASSLSFTDSVGDCILFGRQTSCTFCPYESVAALKYPYATSSSASEYVYQDYEMVSCNFPGVCPDGIVRNTCNWRRYMMVDCGTYSSKTYETDIYIYTNGVPDHCYYASISTFIASDSDVNSYDFKTAFNLPWQKTEAYYNEVI
jgi:hypothetical protein